jgi:hypothetical protein
VKKIAKCREKREEIRERQNYCVQDTYNRHRMTGEVRKDKTFREERDSCKNVKKNLYILLGFRTCSIIL